MYVKIRIGILGLDCDRKKISLRFYIFYTEFWIKHLPLHNFPNLRKLVNYRNY